MMLVSEKGVFGVKYHCQSMIHARYHQGNLISSLVEQSLH